LRLELADVLGEVALLLPELELTFFMRFAIDAGFLDRDLVVVGIEPSLGPWRTATWRGAKSVVELASGECERRGIETRGRPGGGCVIASNVLI